MARTKSEIRSWLNARVGKKVKDKSNYYLDGQCVALIKALLEFLGAPNPYQARGNAKDYGDTLLRQGIAKKGRGYLNVVVNRSMGVIGGVRYGHIWVDLKDYANYEQNGARALHVTKNTRPYSQRQQVINLDKYIISPPRKHINKAVVYYTVKAGDTLSRIAGIFKTSVGKLATINNIRNPNFIRKGQKLKITGSVPKKPSKAYYTVKKGDTMSGIAKKYKKSLSSLAKLNPQIKNLNDIDVGQKVRVK